MERYPSKPNALSFLKSINVQFGTIIDVGTHEETRELRLAFPDIKHLLFEPAAEFFPKIAANYSGMNIELFPVAVSDIDDVGLLQKVSVTDGEISHAKLTYSTDHQTANYEKNLGVSEISVVRLDTILKTRNDIRPFLLKIDVDGNELQILKGAEGIWDDIDCIIVEATADTFIDRLSYIASRGFRMFDIVDQCYYAGVFSQADIIMVSKRLCEMNHALLPWENQIFSWDKWIPVANYEKYIP